MSSVWFEQVDRAFIDEVRASIRIRNRNGGFSRLTEDEQVIIRKPEEDFKIEIYPCVSIYNDRYSFDPQRYNEIPSVKERNAESHLMTMQDAKVPFTLNYQLDFWAKYQSDMNNMVESWLFKHFRQFVLKVKNESGVPDYCNVVATQQVMKSNLMSDGKRIFHTIFNYAIWVELESENRYNVPMVTDVIIKEVV